MGLADAGSRNHCINAGGDVRVRGRPAAGRHWHVGITHPLRPGAFTAAVALTDGAVATSGTAERGLHVFNPLTGQPAAELASVTIVGPSLTPADAYATAALAMGVAAPAWLGSLDGYESGKPRLVEPWLRRIPGGLIRRGQRLATTPGGRPAAGTLLPPRLAPGDYFGPQPAQVLLVLAELRRLG